MVEVFKTNVSKVKQAKALVQQLAAVLPACKINFDLTDCDKILRVEGEHFLPCKIIELLQAYNVECMALE